MAKEELRKKVDLAFLSAFYGGLLTEKQRRVLSLHCEEDLSLGEIAVEVGISHVEAGTAHRTKFQCIFQFLRLYTYCEEERDDYCIEPCHTLPFS